MFEVCLVLSGFMPNPRVSIATYGILIQLASIAYMFPLSLLGMRCRPSVCFPVANHVYSYITACMSDACITRVSNLLGAQQPIQAQIAALTNLLLTFSTQTAWCIGILALRTKLPLLWTHDQDVLDHVAVAAIPAALLIVPDGCTAAFNGMCTPHLCGGNVHELARFTVSPCRFLYNCRVPPMRPWHPPQLSCVRLGSKSLAWYS